MNKLTRDKDIFSFMIGIMLITLLCLSTLGIVQSCKALEVKYCIIYQDQQICIKKDGNKWIIEGDSTLTQQQIDEIEQKIKNLTISR